MPERIQLRRTKGWRKPDGAVVVARPSKWGNPFPVAGDVGVSIVGYDGLTHELDIPLTPAIAVAMYSAEWEASITPLPATGIWPPHLVEEDRQYVAAKLAELEELRGRDLACWCPLQDAEGNRVPCHADVLLELANR